MSPTAPLLFQSRHEKHEKTFQRPISSQPTVQDVESGVKSVGLRRAEFCGALGNAEASWATFSAGVPGAVCSAMNKSYILKRGESSRMCVILSGLFQLLHVQFKSIGTYEDCIAIVKTASLGNAKEIEITAAERHARQNRDQAARVQEETSILDNAQCHALLKDLLPSIS